MYAKHLGNLDEMDTFLETKNLLRLIYKEIEHLNIFITSKYIESKTKNLLEKKIPGSPGFPGELYQTFKEELKPLLKIF